VEATIAGSEETMVNGRLSIAEQPIDQEVHTELFRGRQIELVTGRVLLHALDDRARALCGHDPGQLTPIDQTWDAGYLPHLPRCRRCLAQVSDAFLPGQDDPPSRACDVDIRAAHGSDQEIAAAVALRAVLAEYDLRRWMFTDLITIDETVRGGFSHPLTVSPALLVRRPALTLTSFLHEQLHWLAGSGTGSAGLEVRELWPDPPAQSAGGAADVTSTWLHLIVCALEHHSLSELLGASAAAEELRQHKGYSWIYGQVLARPDWFSDFLQRHGLQVPADPPIPRRCFSDMW
jgi:hypothetical protein